MSKKATGQIVTQLDRELNEFIFDRQARNLSKNTIAWYRNSFKPLRAFLASQNVTETAAITPSLFRLYLIHLQGKHNADGVYNLFGAVRAYLKWFASESAPKEWINPLDHVQAPQRSKEVMLPLALTDFAKLIDTCKHSQPNYQRDRAMLFLLLDTGLRQQELTDLVISDIDLATNAVYVRSGKGRKSRTTFIGEKTKLALSAYLRKRPKAQPGDPLWIKPDGKRLTKNGIRQMVARRAKSAGMKEPGLHEFRRAFAINFLRNGGDVVTLQRLLGHATLQIINSYLALVDEDLRRSHAQHGVVDRLNL